MKNRANPIFGILRQTGRNLLSSWPTQLTGLLTVMLAVLIFSFFLLIQLNIMAAGERLGGEIRLTVYLEAEVAPPMQQRIRQQIEQFGEIAEVRFISRQEAFNRFAQRLGEEREILEDLGPDFLPPAIEVRPRSGLKGADDLERLAAHLLTLPDATKVQYGREWLERFSRLNKILQTVVLISGLLLILNMIFTISHTIRLTLAARREEIEVLRLLGADRSYITLPFLAEGLLQGGLGSGMGLGALFLLYRQIDYGASDPGLLGILSPVFLPPEAVAAIILGGTMLCLVGSLLVINRSQRV